MRTLVLIISLFTCNCASIFKPVEPEFDYGLPWEDLVGTTWYIAQSGNQGIEEWTFYKDSVVVLVDKLSIMNQQSGRVDYHLYNVYELPDTIFTDTLHLSQMFEDSVFSNINGRDLLVSYVGAYQQDGSPAISWLQGEAMYRQKHIGRIFKGKKDKASEYYDGTYQVTELQWKQYHQALTDYCDWAPIYDWSTYQNWFVHEVFRDSLYFGKAPEYYTFYKEPPIEVIYPEGWIWNHCP